MQYWDTSALAKLYVSESDSSQFSAHSSTVSYITTSTLTRWELFSVLARKEKEGGIPVGAAEVIYLQFLSEVSRGAIVLREMSHDVELAFRPLVLRLYRSSTPLFVRAMDGIHLATASVCGTTEMVSTDLNLRKCAGAAGIRLFP